MASTTETPPKGGRQPRIGGCGGCTYTYDPGGGCYNRQGTGNCTGACRCSLYICGVGSQVIQNLLPASVNSGAAVTMNCLMAASDEEWIAKALIELALEQGAERAAEQIAPATFWKPTAIGLGVLSALLAIGLVVSLIYR